MYALRRIGFEEEAGAFLGWVLDTFEHGSAPKIMYELEGGLKTLRVPTLVLVGNEDAPALDASRFLAARIPDAILHVLPATGHTLNLEEPEAFNGIILDFLRDRRRPRT